ncbi:MAG: carbon storage regulator [Candidatus Brocadiaceae bacterium]|nr:carbon storage regulator [Candidatus Brocadiaceae bacterium]
MIGDNIKITVEKISKGQIKIGIEAPKEVVVCREEVVRVINEENELSSAFGINVYAKEELSQYIL